jgi:uncharacterized membrane protein
MKNLNTVDHAGDKNSWNDAKMEGIMGNLLRAGVLLSAFVVACGGILYLVQFGGVPPHHTVFKAEPADLRTIPGIVRDMARGGSRGIIQFGLLLLIATPIARVVFAAYAFGRERDRLYVGVSLMVLAVLIYSIVSPYL